MSDLRELKDAELDIVCGGASFASACNPATASFATKRSPTSCGENLVKEIVLDILRILEPQRNRATAD